MNIRSDYDIDLWPEYILPDQELLIQRKAIRIQNIKSRLRKELAEKEKKENEAKNHRTCSKRLVAR